MKLGCDPEIFLRDASFSLVSAIDRIGGSKESPRPLLELGEGYAVQEDNVAAEFNIPPASDADEFKGNVAKTLRYLEDLVNAQGLHLAPISAGYFPKSQLQDERALAFGCDPDYNAWTCEPNPRPHSLRADLRSCGGHVHVGHTFENPEDCLELIKFMDLFLGVPSIMMDKGNLRRELYGKAGAFRAKPYGVEYRTLSNFWVFDPRLCEWVWNATAQAMDAWQNKKINIELYKDDILKSINEDRIDIADRLIGTLNLPVCTL
jgi:hypothetical protein